MLVYIIQNIAFTEILKTFGYRIVGKIRSCTFRKTGGVFLALYLCGIRCYTLPVLLFLLLLSPLSLPVAPPNGQITTEGKHHICTVMVLPDVEADPVKYLQANEGARILYQQLVNLIVSEDYFVYELQQADNIDRQIDALDIIHGSWKESCERDNCILALADVLIYFKLHHGKYSIPSNFWHWADTKIRMKQNDGSLLGLSECLIESSGEGESLSDAIWAVLLDADDKITKFLSWGCSDYRRGDTPAARIIVSLDSGLDQNTNQSLIDSVILLLSSQGVEVKENIVTSLTVDYYVFPFQDKESFRNFVKKFRLEFNLRFPQYRMSRRFVQNNLALFKVTANKNR